MSADERTYTIGLNIYSPQSKGANRLIGDGAHPLTTLDDLLEVLELTMVVEQQSGRMELPENALEVAIFEQLG